MTKDQAIQQAKEIAAHSNSNAVVIHGEGGYAASGAHEAHWFMAPGDYRSHTVMPDGEVRSGWSR